LRELFTESEEGGGVGRKGERHEESVSGRGGAEDKDKDDGEKREEGGEETERSAREGGKEGKVCPLGST